MRYLNTVDRSNVKETTYGADAFETRRQGLPFGWDKTQDGI